MRSGFYFSVKIPAYELLPFVTPLARRSLYRTLPFDPVVPVVATVRPKPTMIPLLPPIGEAARLIETGAIPSTGLVKVSKATSA